MQRFDPANLTPNASLNRVRFVEAPIDGLDEDVRDQTAYGLLAKETLLAELRDHARSLGLDATDLDTLPLRFGRCFLASDERIVGEAHTIARRWGGRLAVLVLVLKRGSAAQRAARAEWNESHWEHWGSIERLWLGGGIMAGPFGRAVVEDAQDVLEQAGTPTVSLSLTPHPAYLPLLGAARSISPDATQGLVFDFGGTAVKRAVPVFASGQVTALRLLPPVPVVLDFDDPGVTAQAEETRTFVGNMFIETIRAVTPQSSRLHIVASMSAYMAQGRILPGQGGRFSALTDGIEDAATWFAEHIRQQTGIAATIDFVHDGTAAARTFAGKPRTAVIVIGTALGSGFPPQVDTLRPLAPDVIVTPWDDHIK